MFATQPLPTSQRRLKVPESETRKKGGERGETLQAYLTKTLAKHFLAFLPQAEHSPVHQTQNPTSAFP